MLTDALNQLKTQSNPDQMRGVLLDIANAFIERDDDDVDAEERRIFGDFIATALDRLGDDIKALIAEIVCDSSILPREVVHQAVQHSSPDVALPFIEFSPTLNERELVALAETQGEERQIAIARRDDVTAPISTALIQNGTDTVLVALSENQTAAYSSVGLAQLLNRVGDNPLVQASLSQRSKQQKGFDRQIFDSVDESLRSKLGAFLNMIDQQAYQQIARTAAEGIAQSAGNELSNRMSRYNVLQKVKAGMMSFDAAFGDFCAAERPQDCVWALSERLGLPETLVSANFMREESDRIAILCRAADVSAENYAAFSRMRLFAIKHPDASLDALSAEYANVDAAQARRAVRIVKLRSEDLAQNDRSEYSLSA